MGQKGGGDAERVCIICLEECAPGQLTALRCLGQCDLVVHRACMNKYVRHCEGGDKCPICRGGLSGDAHSRVVRLWYRGRRACCSTRTAVMATLLCAALILTISVTVSQLWAYCSPCQPGGASTDEVDAELDNATMYSTPMGS